MILALDTHSLIWHLTDSKRLGRIARDLLEDLTADLILPAMILTEARFLSQRGRISLAWDEISRFLDEDARCQVHPIDREVVEHLPVGLNIHDGIICATALVYRDARGEDARVVTRDRQIRTSGLVQTVW